MLTRVDRVVIAVRDIRRAQKDAIDLLGLTPAWLGGYPGDQTESVLFHLGNVCIELLSPAPGGESSAALELEDHLKDKGDGIYALALETDDIDEYIAGLEVRGLSATLPIAGLGKDEPSGAYRRFRHCWLPTDETAGVRIGLIQYSSLPEELPPSLPTDGEDSAVNAGDHLVVMTPSPERALDLYGEKLGIRLALDKSFEKRGVRLIFFRLGGFTIEIGSRLDSSEAPLDHAEVSDDNFWGLAYAVPNVDAARERIAKAGLEVSGVRQGNKPGTRVCTVKGEPMGVPSLIISSE
jgi:catechol 2,3-dioxygenase-like lactoylglutathione lyase family enzyme